MIYKRATTVKTRIKIIPARMTLLVIFRRNISPRFRRTEVIVSLIPENYGNWREERGERREERGERRGEKRVKSKE